MPIFSDKLVQRAIAEFDEYQGLLEHQGALKARIGAYWDFLHRPELDGGDDVPWSAAFISYMVHLAGAGAQFPYSPQHSVYFYRTINDSLTMQSRPFLGHRVGALAIRPGDILGMNRGDGPLISYNAAAHDADYSSHADIVVEVDDQGVVHTIGGNVGLPGEVGRKTFSFIDNILKNEGNLDQQAFVVIRSYLP